MTLVFSLFTFCPPGPGERAKLNLNSLSGIEILSLTLSKGNSVKDLVEFQFNVVRFLLLIKFAFAVIVLSLSCGCSAQESQKAEPSKSDDWQVSQENRSVEFEQTRTSGDDWPSFLGLKQDGSSNETGILTDWTAGRLPVVWTRELGEGYAPGTVSKGRYFQFDRIGDDSRLVCLNAETGQELWQFKYKCTYQDMYGYDGGPRSSPIVDGNLVYTYGVEGMVHALDCRTGELVWKLNANERFGVHQNFFGVASPPVICQDKLLLMVGGSPKDNKIRQGQLDQALPNESAIVCLNKESGEELYSIGDDLASYTAIKVAEIDGQDWAFAWLRGGLIAFDPGDGTIHFEFPWRDRKLESVNASTPVVFDNYVFLSECYGIGSVLLKIGKDLPDKHEVVWQDEGRDKKLMTHWNTPIYFEGHLYASSGRHTQGATLRCVDALTGEVKWSQPKLTRCNLTLIDGHLVVVAEDGKMLLIKADPNDFEIVSFFSPGKDDSVRFRYPCWAAPVISNGLMYVRGKDQLVCFELIPE